MAASIWWASIIDFEGGEVVRQGVAHWPARFRYSALMLTRIQEMFATLRQQGWWALIVLAIIGGALWGFAELADEVSDGEARAFDKSVLLAFRTPVDLARP